ncbi:MAG: autotransporter outer membrane beta-barrel domain-containing protein [Selenomonas sp.]|nr:autotransporter outer membrane beta-barrel domain-containing protein [Selenomonas sp.]
MSRKMSKDRKEKWLCLAVGAALMVGVSGVVPGMASAEEVTLQGGEGEFYSSVGEKFSIAHEGWDEKWYSVFADDASTGNTITVTNFTAPGYDLRIAGGYAAGGAVTGNKISVTNSTLRGILAGGYNSADGEVSGNVITLGEGTKVADGATLQVFGGYSHTDSQENVKNNTVNILTAIQLDALKGGENTIYNAGKNGNTLNIAAKNVSTNYFDGFANINFFLPSGIANGDTMLTVNNGGNATDLSDVKVGVAMQSGASLNKNDNVNLIVNANGLNNAPTALTEIAGEHITVAAPGGLITDKKYTFALSNSTDNKALVATVSNVEEVVAGGESGGNTDSGNTDSGSTDTYTSAEKPDADTVKNSQRLKSLVETQAAVATVLNSGSDMLADAGFEQAGAAAVAADSAGKFAPFAAMGGSSLRAESGSHVDTKGFGLNVGFAKEVRRGQSTYLFGPVVEYGRGSYDSYQDNGIKADGSSSYWGVGLLGRQTNDDGVYYEGSLRLGKVKADYSGNLVDRTAEYDSSSKYWAGHLGLGRVYKLKGSNSLDGYVKCFFSHQDGDTVTVNLNNGTTDEISFSSTDSQRFRIGARLSHQVNPESSVYGGLAYQYETQGESRATYHGFDTAAPSVKGGSVMMELGWKTKPGNSPVSLDLGLTGWAGKQRGISGKMGFNWTF